MTIFDVAFHWNIGIYKNVHNKILKISFNSFWCNFLNSKLSLVCRMVKKTYIVLQAHLNYYFSLTHVASTGHIMSKFLLFLVLVFVHAI